MKVNELLHEYHITKNPGLLTDILYELGNIRLWVPTKYLTDEHDKVSSIDAHKGYVEHIPDNIFFRPDLLLAGRKEYLPLFVSQEDSPKNYRESFFWFNITLNQAADFILKMDNENVAGLVVNAFTDPFIVSREFIESRTQKMKSYSVSKDEQVSFEPLKQSPESERIITLIREFANKDKEFNIHLIYALTFTKGNSKSYLISIDANNQDCEKMFRKINRFLNKDGALQYPIDFCVCSETFQRDMKNYEIRPVWNQMMRYGS